MKIIPNKLSEELPSKCWWTSSRYFPNISWENFLVNSWRSIQSSSKRISSRISPATNAEFSEELWDEFPKHFIKEFPEELLERFPDEFAERLKKFLQFLKLLVDFSLRKITLGTPAGISQGIPEEMSIPLPRNPSPTPRGILGVSYRIIPGGIYWRTRGGTFRVVPEEFIYGFLQVRKRNFSWRNFSRNSRRNFLSNSRRTSRIYNGRFSRIIPEIPVLTNF